MNPSRLIPAALALAAMVAAIPATAANDRAAKGEAELAKLVDGRTAGQPVRCLSRSDREDLHVIDGTALVFGRGKTLYVNRPAGISMMRWSDIPVFKLFTDQLCQNDMVELRDSSTGMQGATMQMGEFVPYTRDG
jgi:hypothetical protein